jgi:hypothetical protein
MAVCIEGMAKSQTRLFPDFQKGEVEHARAGDGYGPGGSDGAAV